MRQSEDLPMDPQILAELEAIDATLAGRLVDPEYAELAELTVLVAAERPKPDPDRARAIDERVLRRLGPAAPRTKRRRRTVRAQWMTGLAVLAVALVALVLVIPGGGGSSTSSTNAASSNAGPASPAHRTPTSAAGSSTQKQPSFGATGKSAPPLKTQPLLGAVTNAGSSSSAGSGSPVTPAPTPSARKTIQSAQLQLLTPGRWVDVVAQEVFDVAGQEKAIVRSSQVTASAGSNGSATFNLSIPSANLSDTLNRLSALQHSSVSSRTDGTQDVNGQYLSDQRRLADARALRTSLLKQLAKATTQAEITSLQAQLRSAEASINSDEATLRQLQNQISFSPLYVTINGGTLPVPLGGAPSSGGGLTIGRAAHDAGRILTVAAGVALIALAALLPFVLLAALIAWISVTLRRRRREHALDAG